MRLYLKNLIFILSFGFIIAIGSIFAYWNYLIGIQHHREEINKFFKQSQQLAENILDIKATMIEERLQYIHLPEQAVYDYWKHNDVMAVKDLQAYFNKNIADHLDLVILQIEYRAPIIKGFAFYDTNVLIQVLQKEHYHADHEIFKVDFSEQESRYYFYSSKEVVNEKGKVIGYLYGLIELGKDFGLLHNIKEKSLLKGVYLLYEKNIVAFDSPSIFAKQTIKNFEKESINYVDNYIISLQDIFINQEKSPLQLLMLADNTASKHFKNQLIIQLVVFILLMVIIAWFLTFVLNIVTEDPLKKLIKYINIATYQKNTTIPQDLLIVEYEIIAQKIQEAIHILFETTGAAVFIFNRNHIITSANKEFSKIVDMSLIDIQNKKTWMDFIEDSNINAMQEKIKQYFEHPEKSNQPIEFKLKTSKGVIHICQMVVTLFPDLSHGIASFLDLSHQKYLQQKLQDANEQLELRVKQRTKELEKSKQQLDAAQAVAKIGSFEWNMISNQVAWSEQMYIIFGYTINTTPITLEFFLQHVVAEKRKEVFTIMKKGIETGGYELDIPIVDNCGKHKTIRTIAKYEYKNKKPIKLLGTGQDITHIKILELEKLKNEQMLIQQSRLAAMGEMIGAIAHQWRQPLSSLGGVLINIQDLYEFDELSEQELLRLIQEGEKLITFMSNTIDDFRDFFKPSKSKKNFDIVENTIHAIELISAQLKSYNISYYLHIIVDNQEVHTSNLQEDFPSCMIYGYPNEFKQVVLNILSNAKDAILAHNTSQTGKIIITIQSYQAYNLQYKITIKDNGGGINASIIHRIFDPYFTTKEEGKGTGIGLYMAKMIIEQNMQGILSVANDEEGAVFEIILGARYQPSG